MFRPAVTRDQEMTDDGLNERRFRFAAAGKKDILER